LLQPGGQGTPPIASSRPSATDAVPGRLQSWHNPSPTWQTEARLGAEKRRTEGWPPLCCLPPFWHFLGGPLPAPLTTDFVDLMHLGSWQGNGCKATWGVLSIGFLNSMPVPTVIVPHAHWEAYGRGSFPPNNLVLDSANPHCVPDPLTQTLWGHHSTGQL
jgi:hypothetical protein